MIHRLPKYFFFLFAFTFSKKEKWRMGWFCSHFSSLANRWTNGKLLAMCWSVSVWLWQTDGPITTQPNLEAKPGWVFLIEMWLEDRRVDGRREWSRVGRRITSNPHQSKLITLSTRPTPPLHSSHQWRWRPWIRKKGARNNWIGPFLKGALEASWQIGRGD